MWKSDRPAYAGPRRLPALAATLLAHGLLAFVLLLQHVHRQTAPGPHDIQIRVVAANTTTPPQPLPQVQMVPVNLTPPPIVPQVKIEQEIVTNAPPSPPAAAAPPAPSAPTLAPDPGPPPPPDHPAMADASRSATGMSYPEESRELQEEGCVVLNLHVTAEGSLDNVEVKHTSGHRRLDDAAVEGVHHWKFVPARHNGTPISAWYLQPVAFSLGHMRCGVDL